MTMNATSAVDAFVEETGFGNWFLRTMTWKVHVLNRALNDLQPLLPPDARYDRVLDVGCGFGHSFAELSKRFSPADCRHGSRSGSAAARRCAG